jgi:hypothetical protein
VPKGIIKKTAYKFGDAKLQSERKINVCYLPAKASDCSAISTTTAATGIVSSFRRLYPTLAGMPYLVSMAAKKIILRIEIINSVQSCGGWTTAEVVATWGPM